MMLQLILRLLPEVVNIERFVIHPVVHEVSLIMDISEVPLTSE